MLERGKQFNRGLKPNNAKRLNARPVKRGGSTRSLTGRITRMPAKDVFPVPMHNWMVRRNGKPLGQVLAESLEMNAAGTLCAMRDGKAVGVVASGLGLSWKETPIVPWLSLPAQTAGRM